MSETITVYPLPILKDNYVWILIDKSKKAALVVDPGEARPVSDFLNQHHLKLWAILLTHHHGDHTNGVGALQQACDGNVFGPLNDQISTVTHPVTGNDAVNIAGFPISFEVMDIPGHTLGHIAYYTKGMLFCGDTLFAAGCGRIFEGTPAQMYDTLQKIAALPEDTKIYCGHEYTLNNLKFAETVEPSNLAIKQKIASVTALRDQGKPTLPSTMADEKATNPFLRCTSKELIASVEKHVGHSLPTPLEVFTALREWKNAF